MSVDEDNRITFYKLSEDLTLKDFIQKLIDEGYDIRVLRSICNAFVSKVRYTDYLVKIQDKLLIEKDLDDPYKVKIINIIDKITELQKDSK